MILIAHNIRSLHNVGSIFRSADAFGVEKIYLTGYTGQPPRKEIAKTALGSERRVAWQWVESVTDCLGELRQEGYELVALENGKGAQSIETFRPTRPLALLLGNEVEGISAEVLSVCDALIENSMTGTKQSLNVSVATGIALFALTQKMS